MRQWFRVLVAGVVVTSTGCSGDAEPGPARPLELFRSGSRLQVRWLSAEGGYRQPLEQVDLVTGQPCHWRRFTSEGALYCLPDAQVFFESRVGYFADNTCTRPVAYFLEEQRPATALRMQATSCEQGWRLRYLGQRVMGATFRKTSPEGPCVSEPLPSWAAYAYEVGEPVPEWTFVRGEARQAAREAGLAVQVIEGEDGSSALLDIEDDARSTSCTFALASDSSVRCLPSGVSVSEGAFGYFADERCAERAAASTCTSLRFIRDTTIDHCGTTTSIHEVGEVLESVYEFARDGACHDVRSGTSEVPGFAYRRGEESPASSWVGAAVVHGDARGQLTESLLSVAPSLTLPWKPVDTRWGVECEFLLAGDAQLRCIPAASYLAVQHFADPGCTQRLAIAYPDECFSQPFALERRSDPGGAPRLLHHVYSLGERHLGSVYALQPDDMGALRCQVTSRFLSTYFLLGPELEPSSLVSAELITE
ncbi:hypothetical protein LY474_03460 [Myxococcus stipitatus]|uniref:DUF7481 family protein n=1 Tax=Myxococcus stipitatus TaxID=83455 RepID=UPI001F42D2E0|nr:hypothetical protein [Myxococcus stipitatus]MCE9666863.1 hypothetical protein [Myxococcus stipitatus]